MTTTVTENKQGKKVEGKDMKQIVEVPPGVAEEVNDPLFELIDQAQTAYTSYLQAQKKVASAYQERQRQGEKAYEKIEEQAANSCAEAIEKASQAREKAEWEAEEKCREAKNRAEQAYRDSVSEALRVREETIRRAWEETKVNSERIWKVFQGDIDK